MKKIITIAMDYSILFTLAAGSMALATLLASIVA